MKLKCNVCTESPIVDLDKILLDYDKEVYCPSCGLTMARSTQSYIRKKLQWDILHIEFNKEWGGIPITILE